VGNSTVFIAGARPALRIRSGAGRRVVDHDRAVFDLQQARRLERVQRLVHALARDAGEVADLLLRDLQLLVDAGYRMVLNRPATQRAARASGSCRLLRLEHADELPEPLVQLQPAGSG